MISLSIRRKIMGIAVVLIVLMAVTALLSMASVIQVGGQLDELTRSYIPAYGNLARANIRSVERALDLRRIVIEKLRSPSNDVAAIRARFDATGGEFESEIQSARKLIGGPAATRRRQGGGGWRSRWKGSYYVERRNRTFDHGVQSDGGAAAPQGANSRDLREVCRSAHR